MSVHALLVELQRRHVQLVADGERLRFRPRQAVTSELRDALVEHKRELLALLETEDREVCWRAEAMRPRVSEVPPVASR